MFLHPSSDVIAFSLASQRSLPRAPAFVDVRLPRDPCAIEHARVVVDHRPRSRIALDVARGVDDATNCVCVRWTR